MRWYEYLIAGTVHALRMVFVVFCLLEAMVMNRLAVDANDPRERRYYALATVFFLTLPVVVLIYAT